MLLDIGASLSTFEVEGTAYWACDCGHSWRGFDDECFRCGGVGQEEADTEVWYIVEYQGFRFHTPDVAERHQAKAIEIEPHDPTQPARNIPNVGLTVEAQFAVVELAIARERARASAAEQIPPAVAGVAGDSGA